MKSREINSVPEQPKKRWKIKVEMEGWGIDGQEYTGSELWEEVTVEAPDRDTASDMAIDIDFGNKRASALVKIDEIIDEKPEQANQLDAKNLETIADELDDLQKQENNGRGVGCVQSAVAFLRMGNLDEAKRICFWDHDKIRNYSKLVEYIKSNLFEEGEEHPWSVLERLQKRDK